MTIIWSLPPPHMKSFPLERLSIGFGASNFAAALAEADRSVRLGEERVARRPQDWLNQESLARALMARARLTGSTHDLAQAKRALAFGQSLAPWPSGPLLSSAAHKLATHRIAAVTADLDAFALSVVPPLASERAEAAAMRGDVAMYSGNYEEAERRFREANELSGDASSAFRLAGWRKYSGHFAEAVAAIGRAAASVSHRTPLSAANIYLQVGSVALFKGDWAEAERWFARADQVFPGHWLIEAHLAQMAALRGDYAAAERGYRSSVERSSAPEVMDALASLYRSQGRIVESRALAAEAKTLWTARLRVLPEAYFAHAAEHELALGSPVAALNLARRNYDARPYGDAATLLGAALLANGQPREATVLIERLNATRWRTAQQYVVLSQAYAMLSHGDRSAAARSEAERLNTRAFHAAAGLIWFGHH